MKLFKKSYIALIGLSITAFSACSDQIFTEINTDPNNPTTVATTSLLVSGQKQALNAIRSESIHLRGAQLFAQYYAQNIYTDQSRYLIPVDYAGSFWNSAYLSLNTFNEIIKLNSDESTKAIASAGTAGTNANQIAIARILKSYVFHNLTDVFGNIPYESYGNKDGDFEALQQAPDILTPKYASQQKIYADILNELDQAADTLYKYQAQRTFGASDIIYKGDNSKWYKFANSLRLRLANRILAKEPAVAKQHIEDALAQGVFTTNSDNAVFKYSTNSPNEAPLFRATVIANRKDFAVSNVIVEALSGRRGPFTHADPRLEKYANPNESGDYVGQPYGLPLEAGNIFPYNRISLPGSILNAADYAEVLQEYAEVEFLIAEYKNWDQSHYEKGVKASLEKWGITAAASQDYINSLPSANQETVLTQKYFALYGQGIEGWSELRRTGYPNFIVKKGDLLWSGTVGGTPKTYYFEPEVGNAVPSRLTYPLKEQSTNRSNYQQALSEQGDDIINTKIWWNK